VFDIRDTKLCIVFAFFISIYSTVMVERWKRKEKHIKLQWGLITPQGNESTVLNPDFIGYSKFSWANYQVGIRSDSIKGLVYLVVNLFVIVILVSLSVASYIWIKE